VAARVDKPVGELVEGAVFVKIADATFINSRA